MRAKLVLVIDDNASNLDFLELYFSDTPSNFRGVNDDVAAQGFLKQSQPDIVFVGSQWLSSRLRQTLHAFCKSRPSVKIFALGSIDKTAPFICAEFPLPLQIDTFQDKFLKFIGVPELVKVVVVDDDHDVCRSLKEFLEFRQNPKFVVEYALNGLEGFKVIQNFKPDIAVVDLKMPVKGGAELTKELIRAGLCKRIIILTAAVSFEELKEIRSEDSVSILEKGAPQSYFLDLLAALRKFAAFT